MTAMQFNQGLDNGQTQPRAADFASEGTVNTVEGGKQLGLIFGRDARTGIGHGEASHPVGVGGGNGEAAAAALTAAEPVMMRAAQKGILHKNTASRKVSRLASRVRTLLGQKKSA